MNSENYQKLLWLWHESFDEATAVQLLNEHLRMKRINDAELKFLAFIGVPCAQTIMGTSAPDLFDNNYNQCQPAKQKQLKHLLRPLKKVWVIRLLFCINQFTSKTSEIWIEYPELLDAIEDYCSQPYSRKRKAVLDIYDRIRKNKQRAFYGQPLLNNCIKVLRTDSFIAEVVWILYGYRTWMPSPLTNKEIQNDLLQYVF